MILFVNEDTTDEAIQIRMEIDQIQERMDAAFEQWSLWCDNDTEEKAFQAYQDLRSEFDNLYKKLKDTA